MRLSPRDSFRVSLCFKALQAGKSPARTTHLRDGEGITASPCEVRHADRRQMALRGEKRTAAFRTFVLMAGSEWTAAFKDTELAADRAKPGEIEINDERLRFYRCCQVNWGRSGHRCSPSPRQSTLSSLEAVARSTLQHKQPLVFVK